jgi:hypothetical protein
MNYSIIMGNKYTFLSSCKHGGLLIVVLLACSLQQKTCWKPQKKVMMSTAASFPSVVKPRFIEPVGERTKLPKVDAR